MARLLILKSLSIQKLLQVKEFKPTLDSAYSFPIYILFIFDSKIKYYSFPTSFASDSIDPPDFPFDPER